MNCRVHALFNMGSYLLAPVYSGPKGLGLSNHVIFLETTQNSIFVSEILPSWQLIYKSYTHTENQTKISICRPELACGIPVGKFYSTASGKELGMPHICPFLLEHGAEQSKTGASRSLPAARIQSGDPPLPLLCRALTTTTSSHLGCPSLAHSPPCR